MPPRFKWSRLVWLTGIVAVGVVTATLNLPSGRDPACHGIRLSEILQGETGRGLFMSNVVFPHVAFTNYPPRQQAYFHALYGMGQEAWPVLVRYARTKDPALKSWLMRSTIQRFIPIRLVSAEERRSIAEIAVLALVAPPDERDEIGDPIPALVNAARAGIPGAREALARLQGENKARVPAMQESQSP